MSKVTNKSLFQKLRGVPVFGTFLWFANSYVFSGDPKATKSFAPLKLWLKAILPTLFVAIILTAITLYPVTKALLTKAFCNTITPYILEDFLQKPGSIILSVMPSLLGFGIGVYALLFALGGSFIKEMHEGIEKAKTEGRRLHGSVLMLNADMAFPLSILMLVTAIGVMQQAFPASHVFVGISWVLFWYGLLLTLEIVALLFALVENSLLDKVAINTDDDKTG